jgi:hypothetical protein
MAKTKFPSQRSKTNHIKGLGENESQNEIKFPMAMVPGLTKIGFDQNY